MSKTTPRPWDDNVAHRVPAGDRRVLLSGEPPIVGIRVISEENYQLAVRCVNDYDDLVAVCQWIRDIVNTARDGGAAWCALRDQPGAKQWSERLQAILAKAADEE